MKKALLLFAAIVIGSVKMMAEGLTATLQQGETMTAFYGVNAFVEAYNAAEDGAVITLSEGTFNTVTTIEKSITVIGNMAFDVEGYEKTTITDNVYIAADNVTLEGIYFSLAIYLKDIKDCHIKRCRISTLDSYSSTTHTNTLVDQCVVEYEYAISAGINYCIKNSTIGCFGKSNSTTNVAYIANCYVAKYAYATSISLSYYRPYAVYKNNVLGLYNNGRYNPSFSVANPSEFYNNYFNKIAYNGFTIGISFGSNCINSGNNTTGSAGTYKEPTTYITDSFGMTGDDGTPVGITGGSGFSPYPSVPRVTSKQIDSRTDAQGKLNVNITVTTEETLAKEETEETTE